MARNMFSSGGNPFLDEKKIRKASAATDTLDGDFIMVKEKMTVQGAINKSFILLGIMLITAGVAFVYPSNLFLFGGMLGGLAVVIFASFKMHLSPTLAPLYAALEGFFVGAVTARYAAMFDGIVFSAVSLTVALLFAMLFIYKTGIIKVTSKFRTGVIMATGGIMIVYLLTFVLSFFGIQMPFIHDTGMLGIGISAFVIVIACMNLLLDFDNFEKGEQYGAPKYYEWYSAMGLLITLVWLYIELLRLLAKLSSSD